MISNGISTMTVAKILILIGDNPDRIRSESALAKLCGVWPIPASSGKANRMRLDRSGNVQAKCRISEHLERHQIVTGPVAPSLSATDGFQCPLKTSVWTGISRT